MSPVVLIPVMAVTVAPATSTVVNVGVIVLTFICANTAGPKASAIAVRTNLRREFIRDLQLTAGWEKPELNSGDYVPGLGRRQGGKAVRASTVSQGSG